MRLKSRRLLVVTDRVTDINPRRPQQRGMPNERDQWIASMGLRRDPAHDKESPAPLGAVQSTVNDQ